MKRGDICFINLSKEKEKIVVRPAIIIQNDSSNQANQTTIVAAITSSQEIPSEIAHVQIEDKYLGRQSIVLLNQIKSIDQERILEVVDSVSEQELRMIDHAIACSMGI